MRTLLSGQRTLLAWIRTSLALMGFGFLVARFGLLLRQFGSAAEETPPSGSWMALWMGTAMVAIGVLVNVVAAARHLEFVRQFQSAKLRSIRTSAFEVALSLVLAVLGVLMAAYLVLVRP